jgi:hypothetical protein
MMIAPTKREIQKLGDARRGLTLENALARVLHLKAQNTALRI